ncbi:MAG: hypothetical protein LIO93_10750 [Bacteroidales bacterium]|nr:hypothetical protein [Bacteroidales bacterium]
MNPILNLSTRLAKVFILALGSLLINEQASAQLVTVFKEDFGTGGDPYLTSKPANFDFKDFTYTSDGNVQNTPKTCVITKDARNNGMWGDTPLTDNSGNGYYLFASNPGIEGAPMTIYSYSLSVSKGEFIEFGSYYRAIDNGYNFEIQASGEGIGNQIISTGNKASDANEWIYYSLSVTATQTGTITFSIVDKFGYGDLPSFHSFGVDDITVRKKAIQVISPVSLNTYTAINNTVTIAAEYKNMETTTYGYVWQKYNGSSWVEAIGTGATGSVSGPLTLNFTPLTESAAGYVFYRLVINDTYYSDIITVEYTSTEYIFKEDFGGNFPSTDQTDTGGASGDWWIMPENAPSIITDFTYGDAYTWDKLENAYGQKPIRIEEDGKYVITKLSGVGNKQIPGYPEEDYGWSYGGDCCYDDNTFAGDKTKGYFMNSLTKGDQYKTVYAATIPVGPEMEDQSFIFSVAQLVMWGINSNNPTPLRLAVEYNDGVTATVEADFSVKNSWQQSELVFTVPSNYSGSGITLRISAKSFGDGDLRLGLDDIAVTQYEPSIDITLRDPQPEYCVGEQINIDVVYTVLNAAQYKWQYSSTGLDGNWGDISGGTGVLNSSLGSFTWSFSFQNSGYYRLLITSTEDDYTNALVSNTIQLVARESIDTNKITFSQNTTSPDEPITVRVDYTGEVLVNPQYAWLNTSLSWSDVIGTEDNYTIPAKTDYPASGMIASTTGPYYVDISADGYCKVGKYVDVTINNNRWSENFRNGATDRIKGSDVKMSYTIPGLSYRGDDELYMYSGFYTFTKSTFQNDNAAFSRIVDNTDDGYFLQVSAPSHDAEVSPYEFYKTNIEVCSGGKYSFKAMIANLIPITAHKMQFTFRVQLQEIGNEGISYPDQYYTTDGNPVYTSDWKEYGFDFLVPKGSVSGALFHAVCTIESSGYQWSYSERNFGIDDISIVRQSAAQIIIPENTDITVLQGSEVSLKGIYASCGIPGTDPSASYHWQKSSTGGDNDDDWEELDGISGATTITTGAVTEDVYYRLVAIGSGSVGNTAISDVLKITPVKVNDLGKTYFICPDNMSNDEAKVEKRSNDLYLPGMVTDGEPGYLPSLIHMEVPGLYGVNYKWYDVETGGNALTDGDKYDPDQRYSTIEEIRTPILLSDEKSNTLAVMNERKTDGLFTPRTYWVELLNSEGTPISTDRIEIKLEPGYLCGSTATDTLSNAMVSPNTARRIHRENFEGISESDPEVSKTPLPGIDYEQYTIDDVNVPEGSYKVVKNSPTLEGDSWNSIEDHIYADVPNENPHGYLVAVNATEDPGLFYTYKLENLGACDNLSLLFTGWFTSPVAWSGLEKANLMFKLINTDTGEVLAEFVTGNMIDGDVRWRQFGFMFEKQEGVDNLTLEIINNNFGTTGGNDVLMDDMEIYLNIPPVKQYPAYDSNVCQESNEVNPTGTGVLAGEYIGNGTFLNDLEYWWEFRAEGADQNDWIKIGIVDEEGNKIGNYGTIQNTGAGTAVVKSQYIIPGFTEANNGDYRLLVGQIGAYDNENYSCIAVSEPRKLTFTGDILPLPSPTFDSKDAGDNAEMNITAFCHDNVEYISIVNFDSNTNINNTDIYANYYWMLDEEVIQESTSEGASAERIQLTFADLKVGYHAISLTVTNALGCEYTVEHNFIIFPETTVWTSEGEKNNWNDAENWSDGVPGDCTQAIIPNRSMDVANGVILLDHYPVLIDPTVETLNGSVYADNQTNIKLQKTAQNDDEFSLRPACDTITFRMGASVVRTDYMNYNFAKVDLDVLPNRWYALSAPLRDMYSGDYFEEESMKRQDPIVYMRKYNITFNPETGAPSGAGWSRSFNTLDDGLYPGLGYIIWVDDGNEVGQNIEYQQFRFPRDSVEYTMWNYQGVYQGTVSMPNGGRDNIGKFTYESLGQANGSFDVTVEEDQAIYTNVLVGNPFMSHLNLNEFVGENSGLLKSEGYYLWNGYSFDTKSEAFNDESIVPPMQSFVVEKVDDTVIDKLTFTFDMAVEDPRANTVLRSEENTEHPILRMGILRDNIEHSNVRIKYDPAESNEYAEEKDMWTLFSESVKTSAVLYAPINGKAASIRTMGDFSEPVELGIRTTKKGLLTFHITGLDGLESSLDVKLEDRLTGDIKDLRANPQYTFDNQTGNVEGRLFLNISVRDVVGIDKGIKESSVLSNIRVFEVNNAIRIISSVNDPIQTVRIYSAQGEFLYGNDRVGTSTYTVENIFQRQMLIVAVKTKNTWKNAKIILK